MTDTITVLFKPQNCYPPSSNAHYFDGLKLIPGSGNHLTAEQVTTLLAHPDYPRYRDWGAIEVLGETAATIPTEPAPKSITNLSADDAEKAIEGCFEVATLREWYEAETRRPVRQQIQRRIKAIESGEE